MARSRRCGAVVERKWFGARIRGDRRAAIVLARGPSVVVLEDGGGTIEPLLYVVMLWVTRERPLLCGVSSDGFSTASSMYGWPRSAVCGHRSRMFTRAGPPGSDACRHRHSIGFCPGFEVPVVSKRPCTSMPTPSERGKLVELAGRICISPARRQGADGCSRFTAQSSHAADALGASRLRATVEGLPWSSSLHAHSWYGRSRIARGAAPDARAHGSARPDFLSPGRLRGRLRLRPLRRRQPSVHPVRPALDHGMSGSRAGWGRRSPVGCARVALCCRMDGDRPVRTSASPANTRRPRGGPKRQVIRALEAEGIRDGTATKGGVLLDFMRGTDHTRPLRHSESSVVRDRREHRAEAVRLLRSRRRRQTSRAASIDVRSVDSTRNGGRVVVVSRS